MRDIIEITNEEKKMLLDIQAGVYCDPEFLNSVYLEVKIKGRIQEAEARMLCSIGIPLYSEITSLTDQSISEVKLQLSDNGYSFSLFKAVIRNVCSEDGLFYRLYERLKKAESESLSGVISTANTLLKKETSSLIDIVNKWNWFKWSNNNTH